MFNLGNGSCPSNAIASIYWRINNFVFSLTHTQPHTRDENKSSHKIRRSEHTEQAIKRRHRRRRCDIYTHKMLIEHTIHAFFPAIHLLSVGKQNVVITINRDIPILLASLIAIACKRGIWDTWLHCTYSQCYTPPVRLAIVFPSPVTHTHTHSTTRAQSTPLTIDLLPSDHFSIHSIEMIIFFFIPILDTYSWPFQLQLQRYNTNPTYKWLQQKNEIDTKN